MHREPPPSGLLHPLALAAIGLLIVNDHVLKAHDPGWLTGKLSDVAGMVFFPLLLRALLEPILRLRLRGPHRAPSRRARAIDRERLLIACVAMTALTFAAIKLVEPATAACEQVLGALLAARVEIVRDPTDLLAVPFVLVALWIARRADEMPSVTGCVRETRTRTL
jgi:hypothetical protein